MIPVTDRVPICVHWLGRWRSDQLPTYEPLKLTVDPRAYQNIFLGYPAQLGSKSELCARVGDIFLYLTCLTLLLLRYVRNMLYRVECQRI